ncbi:hypothetical protein [Streptomyces sp. NPDC060243]|uniref:hypothetical protein n=1 Tax=Streptomyces sp. NPDC060243 TaxID=3347081 RepID=UPI003662B1F1
MEEGAAEGPGGARDAMSPSFSSIVSMAASAVSAFIGTVAASWSAIPAGTATAHSAGTTTYSA